MKRYAFLLSLFVVSCLHAASVTYDATALLSDPSGSIELLGGRTLTINVAVPEEAKLLFEDTMPEANWGHPALFKLVTKSGAVIAKYKTELPPLGLEALPVEAGSNGLPPRDEVEFKLDTFEGKLKVADPDKFHAILINGRADKRHWNDFSFLFRVLTQIYGYKKANIHVADGSFISSSPDLDGDGEADIKYGSRLQDIKDLYAKIKDEITEEDQLLIAVNDHGSTKDGESTIVLFDQDIKASEFGALLAAVPAGRVLSIHEQCFSGGFVRPSVSKERVAMAAATDQEYSWASMDLKFDEFIYLVIAAFAQQNYDGKPVKSDINADGKISAQEAFAYAVANDQRRESPLLESSRNSGDAANIGLSF